MIIQCANCNRRFRIGDDRIQPPGANVRCSKCGEIFYVEASREQSEENDVQLEFGGKNPFDESSPIGDDTDKIFDADSIANMILDGITGEKDSPEHVSGDINKNEVMSESDEEEEDGATVSDENEIGKGKAHPEDVQGFNYTGKDSHYDDVDEAESRKPFKPFDGSNLSVDKDALKRTYPESSSGSPGGVRERAVPHEFKRRKSRKGFFSKFFIVFFTVFIISTLIVSGSYLLSEFGVLPKEDFEKYKGLVLSFIPSDLTSSTDGDLGISDLSGRWVDSRYGQVFLVSGKVVNNSGKTVNHIKLRSEFYSVDEKLYEMDFYAGNTVTERDVKNMPFDSIQDKLKRKSGDVNYNDINTLAGLNFDIKPGQSIPFYTVFPSRSRILGLKYNVSVVNFSIGSAKTK